MTAAQPPLARPGEGSCPRRPAIGERGPAPYTAGRAARAGRRRGLAADLGHDALTWPGIPTHTRAKLTRVNCWIRSSARDRPRAAGGAGPDRRAKSVAWLLHHRRPPHRVAAAAHRSRATGRAGAPPPPARVRGPGGARGGGGSGGDGVLSGGGSRRCARQSSRVIVEAVEAENSPILHAYFDS